jgi:hypothetical protein
MKQYAQSTGKPTYKKTGIVIHGVETIAIDEEYREWLEELVHTYRRHLFLICELLFTAEKDAVKTYIEDVLWPDFGRRGGAEEDLAERLLAQTSPSIQMGVTEDPSWSVPIEQGGGQA